MPDRPGHQRRAQENEALFQELQGRQTRLFDWEVTTLFYAALHWVHAYLATVETPLGVHQPEASPGGHHPKTHRLTRSMMSHEPNLRNILDDY